MEIGIDIYAVLILYIQRFNGAPTVKFQQDVGTKTTIRLVNSQLVTTEAGFLKDSLYNEGILIVWDPSVYHSDIPKVSGCPWEIGIGSPVFYTFP